MAAGPFLKRRIQNSGLFILAVTFLTGTQIGCFQYDEWLIIHPNGSGELVIHYQTEKDMKFENLYFPTDRYDIEYNIKKNYQVKGVHPRGHEVKQKEDKTNVYMRFDFSDLRALGRAPRFQNEEFVQSHQDGNIRLQRFLYFDETKLDRTRLLFKTGVKSIFNQGILKEIRFRFQWIVPGEIVESNATLLGDKNRAIWTISLAEILENRSTQFYLTYTPDTSRSQ